MSTNHYAVLGIERSSSDEEVKRAFRRKAKLVHPDRNKSEHAKRQFILIHTAYQILSDADKRSRHDAMLDNDFRIFRNKVNNLHNKAESSTKQRSAKVRVNFDKLDRDATTDYFISLNFDIPGWMQTAIFVFGVFVGLIFAGIPVTYVAIGEWNFVLLILCFPGLYLINDGVKCLKSAA